MKSIKPALLDPAKNFTDWETTVESFDSTIEKGNAMEHLVFFLLKTRSNYYGIKEIYMEDEIPSNIRDRIKLETKDNGVDGVYITSDDKITAYQVKFRSGHAVPTAQELSTFWAESEYADVRLIAAVHLLKFQIKRKIRFQFFLIRSSAWTKNFLKLSPRISKIEVFLFRSPTTLHATTRKKSLIILLMVLRMMIEVSLLLHVVQERRWSLCGSMKK